LFPEGELPKENVGVRFAYCEPVTEHSSPCAFVQCLSKSVLAGNPWFRPRSWPSGWQRELLCVQPKRIGEAGPVAELAMASAVPCGE